MNEGTSYTFSCHPGDDEAIALIQWAVANLEKLPASSAGATIDLTTDLLRSLRDGETPLSPVPYGDIPYPKIYHRLFVK